MLEAELLHFFFRSDLVSSVSWFHSNPVPRSSNWWFSFTLRLKKNGLSQSSFRLCLVRCPDLTLFSICLHSHFLSFFFLVCVLFCFKMRKVLGKAQCRKSYFHCFQKICCYLSFFPHSICFIGHPAWAYGPPGAPADADYQGANHRCTTSDICNHV